MVVSIVILNEAKHKTCYVGGFHCETNTGPCVILRISTTFAADKRHAFAHAPAHFRGKWKALGVEVRLRSQFRTNTMKQYGAPKRSIDVSKCIQFLRFSCNVKTLFYWERKGDLYTSYHSWLISQYKDLKTKGVSWFSLFIGQSTSRQLATSTKNLVASAQFSVALATSESQFRAPS